MGLFVAAFAVVMPFVLTPDVRLWSYMKNLALPVSLALCMAGLDIPINGHLLARRKYGFLVRAMIINLSITVGYVKFAMLMNWGLQGVWWSLVVFFGVRVLQGASKLYKLYMSDIAADRAGKPTAFSSPVA